LRLDGIGPLRLGMTQPDALRSGWLADRKTGCELGGAPLPIVYALTGPRAPAGIEGTAEFARGRLRNLAFTAGVRTTLKVEPGKTSRVAMVRRYREAGFGSSSAFDSTFAGSFVTVLRHGRQVIGGFAERTTLSVVGVPFVPVCE
jgi:hypothetical protein